MCNKHEQQRFVLYSTKFDWNRNCAIYKRYHHTGSPCPPLHIPLHGACASGCPPGPAARGVQWYQPPAWWSAGSVPHCNPPHLLLCSLLSDAPSLGGVSAAEQPAMMQPHTVQIHRNTHTWPRACLHSSRNFCLCLYTKQEKSASMHGRTSKHHWQCYGGGRKSLMMQGWCTKAGVFIISWPQLWRKLICFWSAAIEHAMMGCNAYCSEYLCRQNKAGCQCGVCPTCLMPFLGTET